MDSYHKSKCHKIIHTAAASAAAIATGLAQIPGSDAIPITTIQVGMIIGLGAVFGQEITKSAAKSILGGATAAIGGRTVSQFLVGWIPGIGNAVNATTAFTITEALGWYVANDFANDVSQSTKRPRLAGIGPFVMCVIFAAVLAGLCMLVDAGLEKYTVHFKVWGAVSGIILAVVANVMIHIRCNKRGWYSQSWAVMPYSNYLALVINIVCALVISSGKDVHSWDEAIAEFSGLLF